MANGAGGDGTGQAADGDSDSTILVVDDEPSVRESFTLYLEPLGYRIRTAANVEDAYGQLDDSIDIALLDRRMPDGSGDAVLEEIRGRNLNCRVALVTAVDPDFDIVELDCDDYLVKPVGREDLVETIERLSMLDQHDEKQRQLSNLRVKRNVLELEKHPDALEDSEEFQRLEREIGNLETELEDLETEFETRLGFTE
jgi:DNA-binding response OmpR family regulator